MTPEQEIRAAALQAAATLCAHFTTVETQQIPGFVDIQFVSAVFEVQIAEGPEAALRLYEASQAPPAVTQDAPEPEPAVKDVELREQEHPVGDILMMSFDDDPPTIPRINPAPQAASEAPAVAASAPAPEPQTADVIPLAVRGTVDGKQDKARRKIEGMRHQRAQKLVQQAKTAKVPAHKERLRDEADEAGLTEFQIEIDGKLQVLGAYLASL